MPQMVLGLNKPVEFTYNGKARKGTVVELRPKHDMVLVQMADGTYRNFKISKIVW